MTIASATATGSVMASTGAVPTSTSALVPASASLTATVSPKTSAPNQLQMGAGITSEVVANEQELPHSGDTTDEADYEDDGGEERDRESGGSDEDEEEECKKEHDEEVTDQAHDEDIEPRGNKLSLSKVTTAGTSLATAIIVIDDDTEPNTESDPEHTVKTTNGTAQPCPTSTKRKAAALSAPEQLQQDIRPPRRRRLFAPPAPPGSIVLPAPRARRTSGPPPMSPTRSSHAFSDVLRSSRKLRTVQHLESNPDAGHMSARFAPLPSFTNATNTAPVIATKPAEPSCAPETCPILLSLGLNPFSTTEDAAIVYDPLGRTHIPFPISTTAQAGREASPRHKHDRDAIHQAVHVWQRQKSRLNTLAGLVDDDWVKGEIKACVSQMGLVMREAWRELWYCESQPDGSLDRLEGEGQGDGEVDKENTFGASTRLKRNTGGTAEARILRIREEGVVYVQAELDPRSPMPMPAAKPRTPMVQRVGGSTSSSPSKGGGTSPKRRFHVFTDKLQLYRQ